MAFSLAGERSFLSHHTRVFSSDLCILSIHIEIKMAPPGSAHLNFSLGGLVALGGAMGYMKKGVCMLLLALGI